MIVYLARDIPTFVMYCVNGESGSSLLIESIATDSMMLYVCAKMIIFQCDYKYIHEYKMSENIIKGGLQTTEPPGRGAGPSQSIPKVGRSSYKQNKKGKAGYCLI